MEPEQEWRVNIEEAYKVFAHYTCPETMKAAPKHNVPEVLMQLRASSLKTLSADNLGAYAGSAIYTIGTVDDYKHFLPRILELGRGEHPWLGLSPEVIAGKLVYSEWTQWPKVEQAVVRDVFASALRMSRGADPDVLDASHLLCANAILGTDLNSLLSDWLPPQNGAVVVQLARIVQAAMRDGEDAAYWESVSAEDRRWLREWSQQKAVWDAFNAPFDLPDDSHAWDVKQARKTVMRH
ncbi:hypothetical protein [Asticcacaulis solisilvae]|uniref:hypothetical protein n=1 Tax=Asticcacaulis solisilvae TaxID=1217274 RepID=UPI003FD80846